jgi:hypothetical protein
MTDPTGSIAPVAHEGLQALLAAYEEAGVPGITAEMQMLASRMGVSTAELWNGVFSARGSSAWKVADLAEKVYPHLIEARAAGALELSGDVIPAGEVAAPGVLRVVAGAGARLVGRIAALSLGWKLLLLAAVGAAVYGGAVWLGSRSGDEPLRPTDRTAVPFTNPNPDGVHGASYVGIGAYLDGKLAIVSVRTPEAVAAGIVWCDFHLGGTDCATKAPTRVLTAEYADAADATRELCAQLDGAPYPPALSEGYRAPLGAGSVVVDDWSALDLDACTAAAAG